MPSDTANERRVLREAIEDWNGLHAESHGVMLLPLIWERDATPDMSDRPQGVINRELVDLADVLVGVFWTRLGTQTSEAESGTVEEIERCIKADKPVRLYFSSRPIVIDSVNLEEYERLAKAREDFERRGLVDRFHSEEELSRKATAALTRTVRAHFAGPVETGEVTTESAAGAPHASILATIDRQRELRSLSRSGEAMIRSPS
jgi:hypothetical protein